MHQLKELVMRKPKTSVAIAVCVVILVAAAATLSRRSGSVVPTYGSASGGLAVAPSMKSMVFAVGAPAADRAAYGEGVVLPPVPETGGQTAAEVDQKIIKNGDLSLVVDKASDAVASISSYAASKGGFVQSSSVYERADGTQQGNVIIRLPSAAFDAAMRDIKGFATQVKNETQTGQDVTEQYTDLQAQLRNAQAQEETYLSILKQARSVEDILKVQEQLGSIRGQIESLQGRIKYLENVTTYSTISVSLEEEPAVRVPTKEFRPLTIAKQAIQTLVDVAQESLAALIWAVIVFGGTLVPIALLVWAVVALWRRRRS